MGTKRPTSGQAETSPPSVVVVVSADAEWRSLREVFRHAIGKTQPYGEWFVAALGSGKGTEETVFASGGWGKVSAAASTQYVIARWKPDLLINIGTCGGIAGKVDVGETILVERTVIYDIGEQMEDPASAITHYETKLDLTWLRPPYPTTVSRGALISGDRDLVPDEVRFLAEKHGALGGDWESGAIAWVAHRHAVRTLILRSVTDVVSDEGSAVYGRAEEWKRRAAGVMRNHLKVLPLWISRFRRSATAGTGI